MSHSISLASPEKGLTKFEFVRKTEPWIVFASQFAFAKNC
jgi:hypothetical protein